MKSIGSILFTIISCLTLGVQAADVQLHSIQWQGENPSAGQVRVQGSAPTNSLVTLQSRANLESTDWTNALGPFLAPPGGVLDLLLPVAAEMDRGFFRLKADLPEIPLSDDGRQIKLSTTNPIPAILLFDAIRRATGRGVFATTNSFDPFALIPATNLCAASPEELLRLIGLKAWVTPPATDDEDFAGRLTVNTNNPTVFDPADPRPPGTNTMDQGFPGTSGAPTPQAGADDPRPDPGSSKPLDPNVPPAPDGFAPQESATRIEPGRHVRLTVEMNRAGGVTLRRAIECPGDSLRPPPQAPLSEDSLVFVFRSPSAGTEPGLIYAIQAERDPFEVHTAEFPDDETGHGRYETTAIVNFPVPVLEDDTNLAGVLVEIFRVTGALPPGALDAAAFLRQPASFTALGFVSGAAIEAILTPHAAGGGGGLVPAGLPAPTLTPLVVSGSKAKKFNLVFIGDGFNNSANNQGSFNTWITNVVFHDLFSKDVHPEMLNAFNIYRINTFSQDSGLSQVNSTGGVTVARNTALSYRYSGTWSRFWLEPIPTTANVVGSYDRIESLRTNLIPEANLFVVVANQTNGGGRANGNVIAMTLGNPFGSNWGTLAHEVGHAFGSLGDEYYCLSSNTNSWCKFYSATNPEPGAQNLTKQTVWKNIKWNVWIPPTRPLPMQTNTLIADVTEDVGAFTGTTIGGSRYWGGMYRPSWNGTMNGNTPPHNPIGYRSSRFGAKPYQEDDLRRNTIGDFDGDGRADVLVRDGRHVALFRSRTRNTGAVDPVTLQTPRASTGVLEPAWFHTGNLLTASGNSHWIFDNSDLVLPGDFDGDGQADLIDINLTRWNQPYLCLLKSTGTNFVPVRFYAGKLPGWDEMRPHDEFYTGDFDGDGKTDLMVYNGQDWDGPYFLMLRSTGTQFEYVRRYDHFLPGWEMGRHEKIYLGDFNGDGRIDPLFLNRDDWNQVHLMNFTSTGTKLTLADRYYGLLSAAASGIQWTMRHHDVLLVGDYNGDGISEFALFNGRNWQEEYLGLFSCNSAGHITPRRVYDHEVQGWTFGWFDRFYVADVDGDGDSDLVVRNRGNYPNQHLAFLRTHPSFHITASYQSALIGSWPLSNLDQYHPAEFKGGSGWQDMFVFHRNAFALFRSVKNGFALEAIYPDFIHNHRYHGFGYW